MFPLKVFSQRGYTMAMSLINTEVDARDHTELKQYRVLDLCLAAKLLASWELIGSYNKLVPILDVFLSDAVMSSPARIYHTTNDVPELQLTKLRALDFIKGDPVPAFASLHPHYSSTLAILMDPYCNTSPSSKILLLKDFYDKNNFLPTPAVFSSIPVGMIHPSLLSTHAQFLAKIFDHSQLLNAIACGSFPYDSAFADAANVWLMQTTLCNQRYIIFYPAFTFPFHISHYFSNFICNFIYNIYYLYNIQPIISSTIFSFFLESTCP